MGTRAAASKGQAAPGPPVHQAVARRTPWQTTAVQGSQGRYRLHTGELQQERPQARSLQAPSRQRGDLRGEERERSEVCRFPARAGGGADLSDRLLDQQRGGDAIRSTEKLGYDREPA